MQVEKSFMDARLDELVKANVPEDVAVKAIEEVVNEAPQEKVYEIRNTGRRKLMIVAFAPDSREKAPLDDTAFDVWGLNELYMEMPMLASRANLWFQLHGNEPPTIRDPQQAKSLSLMPFPVFMWRAHPEIPNSIPYPLADILRHFDVFGEGMATDRPFLRDRAYFTNSVSWMIAAGILFRQASFANYDEMHLYGVNMAQDQEFCLEENMRVLTADLRWIPVSELVVGQTVIAFDEYPAQADNQRKWRCATVEATSKLNLPSYRLNMSDGSCLESSADHRWLVQGPTGYIWKETKNLTTSDKIVKLLGVKESSCLAGAFNREEIMQVSSCVAVEKIEFLGEQPVIGLKTSTGTFIAEGFASHNSHQRPSCEFFLGWARGAGMKIYLPPESDLLKTPLLYGYDDGLAYRIKLDARHKELEGRLRDTDIELNKARQVFEQNQAVRNQLVGALSDNEYMLKLGPNDLGVRTDVDEKIQSSTTVPVQ